MRSSRPGWSRIVFAGHSAVFVCILSMCVAAMAQDAAPETQDSAQPAPPALSVTTHEVLLDVVVTEGGHPVRGLKASDFTVLEEGKAQVVASLEEHGPMSVASTAQLLAAPPLPPNTFSNYTPVANSNAYTVILLDALNTRLDDQMLVRLELIKYLKHMAPGVPVALFERDTKMHLVQGFTSDPAVLLGAAEGARNKPAIPNTVRGTREEYMEYRLDAVSLGFQMLGRYLAAFPGRKNLIWFMGALPGSDSLEPMGDPFNDEFKILEGDPHDLTAALTLSRVAVYPIDSRGLQAAPQYLASTKGVPAAGAPAQFETKQAFDHLALDAVAESTGGRAYYNSNGIGQKIDEIEANGSDYYTLTYATANKNWNSEFRRIKIEVDQPHEKLQYRQGYYAVDRSKDEQAELRKLEKNATDGNRPEGVGEAQAPATDAPAAAASPSGTTNDAAKKTVAGAEQGKKAGTPKEGFDEAMQLGAIPPTEIIFAAHATAGTIVEQIRKDDTWPQDNYLAADYKYKPFRTYTVDFSVDGKTLNLARRSDGLWHGSVAFVTVVYDQTGQNVNSKLTTTNMDLDDDQYRDLVEHGLTARHPIAVPAKGSYFLRLGVHDVVNDRIGSLEVAVDRISPEAAAGQVSRVQ